ncbi:hypothetical protein [Streptomyces sp. NPDC048057]|uniref:hypothetical protein n=1 Tax=Streptomyces sp. NPDC048057 TaxID=3155628 RepID=UPI0033ED6E1F
MNSTGHRTDVDAPGPEWLLEGFASRVENNTCAALASGDGLVASCTESLSQTSPDLVLPGQAPSSETTIHDPRASDRELRSTAQ